MGLCAASDDACYIAHQSAAPPSSLSPQVAQLFFQLLSALVGSLLSQLDLLHLRLHAVAPILRVLFRRIASHPWDYQWGVAFKTLLPGVVCIPGIIPGMRSSCGYLRAQARAWGVASP